MICGRQREQNIGEGWKFSMSGGEIRFILSRNQLAYGGKFIYIDTVSSFKDGLNHMVTITYDGSSNASGVNIYGDGNLQNVNVIFDTWDGDINSSSNFNIGARANSEQFWDGTIGFVRIYNRELSTEEAKQNYNALKWRFK